MVDYEDLKKKVYELAEYFGAEKDSICFGSTKGKAIMKNMAGTPILAFQLTGDVKDMKTERIEIEFIIPSKREKDIKEGK